MSTVKTDISMSLDGFVAGPGDSVEEGLGRGGEQLHEWIFGLRSWRERHSYEGGEEGVESELLEEAFAGTRAVVMGRRMFDFGAPHWGEDPPFHVPVFVVTHRGDEPLVKSGGTTFTFVTEGFARAVDLARSAAEGGDVSIAGGASVIQQALTAGLLDELQLHVVPILLGGGVRLFEGVDPAVVRFEPLRTLASPAVTHLKLPVVRP